MSVRIVRPEVALIGHTVRRDAESRRQRRTDDRGDAGAVAAPSGRMCFDGATEVLTDRGWRRFAALTRNERLATLNAETWNIEYHRPTDYFEYDCDEPLFVVDSPYVNLAVTGEHWLYVAGSGERGFRLRRTAETAARSLRFLRGGHWHGERPGRASGVGEIAGPRVRLSASAGGGRAASPALGVRARSVPLSPFLAFLGRYLASGVCYAPPGGPGRVVMPRSAGTLELVGACGFNARTRRSRVLIEDAPLYDYLGSLGESHSKRIPRALLELDAESLRILRGALFQGRRRFTTPSPQLAGDVQELLLKTGASGNCSQTRPGRYAVDTVEEWTPLVRRGPHLAAAPYGGKVWCVTVPNHIVYVRREGIPVWAGNCGRSSDGRGWQDRSGDAPGRRAAGAFDRATVTLSIQGFSSGLAQELVRERSFSLSRLSRLCPHAGAPAGGTAAPASAGAPAGLKDGRLRAGGRGASERRPGGQGAWPERSADRNRGREPDRSVAREGAGTRFAVTGELRAWAAFLARRAGSQAEPEMGRLALLAWPVLHGLAPEVFHGFRRERAADGREVLVGGAGLA